MAANEGLPQPAISSVYNKGQAKRRRLTTIRGQRVILVSSAESRRGWLWIPKDEKLGSEIAMTVLLRLIYLGYPTNGLS